MIKPKVKKWIDPQDVEITGPLHKAFIAAEVAGETEADKGKAVQALIEQIWLNRQGLENASPPEKQKAIDALHKNQRAFDPDDFNLAGARKAINKLGAGDHTGAVQAAQNSMEHRGAIRQDTKDKLGAAGRDTRSRNAETRKQLIIEDYRKNKGQFPKKALAYTYYAELYGIGYSTVRGYLIGV
jgi:hypothetical protein